MHLDLQFAVRPYRDLSHAEIDSLKLDTESTESCEVHRWRQTQHTINFLENDECSNFLDEDYEKRISESVNMLLAKHNIAHSFFEPLRPFSVNPDICGARRLPQARVCKSADIMLIPSEIPAHLRTSNLFELALEC